MDAMGLANLDVGEARGIEARRETPSR